MKAIWTGHVSFGLINIPVRLFSACEEHPITFDLLHKTDLSPIRYAKICKEEDKEITYTDLVKGYEYQEGQYIVIDENDLKIPERVKSIEIKQFARLEEVDFIFFERPYYLEPGKGGEKAYALLRETLRISKKVAIVKFIIRNKEHLGLLKEYQNIIILDQMRFPEEMRNSDELKLPSEDLITKTEMDMSLKLVNQLTKKFNPKNYRDEYTEQLKELIEAKLRKKPLPKKTIIKKSSKIHDITALLEASLKSTKVSKPVNKNPAKRAKNN